MAAAQDKAVAGSQTLLLRLGAELWFFYVTDRNASVVSIVVSKMPGPSVPRQSDHQDLIMLPAIGCNITHNYGMYEKLSFGVTKNVLPT